MPAVKPVTFEVEGLREVMDRLLELPGRTARNVVRRSIYAGAVIIRDDARLRVSKRTGALRKAIIARTNRRNLPTMYFGEVTIAGLAFTKNEKGKIKRAKKLPGQTKKYLRGQIYPRNYAHLVEFGTRPHAVGRGSRLKGVLGTQTGRMHPGAKPKPFIRPAYEAKKFAAVQAIREAALEGIEKEVLKLSAKGGLGARRTG